MDLSQPSPDSNAADPAAQEWPPAPRPLHTPVPFGHWLVTPQGLECRLPAGRVSVRAPRSLLRQILALCDGTHSWQEVMAALGRRWAPADVAPFMGELVRTSALVEAGELWAHWSVVAQLPQMPSGTAGAEEIALLPERAERRLVGGSGLWDDSVKAGENPIAATLRLRESIRTFDDRAVTAQVLCSILWAAHGVVRAGAAPAPRWHRSVASAGNMHSARWFVAVLRTLPCGAPAEPTVPPGAYEARFHMAGGASLAPLNVDVRLAWHCLRDPRVLRHASALVLPLYDIAVPARKYGNRATLFAALEAGQSMQNAQLMTASLGAACMLRGDTVAPAAIALAGVARQGHHWLCVPGLVVGAMPSAEQMRQQRGEARFRLVPNLQPRAVPATAAPRFAFAAVPEDAAEAVAVAGSGRAHDPRLALDLAEAEAWERLGWATLGRTVEAAAKDVPHALDPRRLVAYSARQHAARGFPFVPFQRTRAYLWTDTVDTDSGAPVAVPAECVHALHALPARFQKTACTSSSTSGMAAGADVQDALERATLELVERDAFCRSWLSGLPAPGIHARSLPGELRHRVADLQAQDVELSLVDLSMNWCVVIAVFLQSPGMPFTAITAAAGFDLPTVAGKALSEAEGRLAFALHFPAVHGAADAMRRIERYYRHPRSYRRSDFFRPGGSSRHFGDIGRESAKSWEQMRCRLRQDGYALLCIDVTPAGAAIDQGRRAVKVVRALVPGLVPIWFHQGLQPAGLQRFTDASAPHRGRPAGHFLHPFT